jgi:hypothetical protein
MTLWTVLLIILIIFIIYHIYKSFIISNDYFSVDHNTLVKSTIDGKYYYIHDQHANKQEAANLFAEINSKVTDFLNYLYEKYKNSTNSKRKEVATLMYKRYNTQALRENSPLNSERDTSFTINKGDIIAICIRDINTNNIQDINLIMFVVLHELTHLSIKAYDHPQEFWDVFRFILSEAVIHGTYIPVNYEQQSIEYCGLKINYNPLYDNTLPDI